MTEIRPIDRKVGRFYFLRMAIKAFLAKGGLYNQKGIYGYL